MADGATTIRNAIDRQYGQGFGARVFQHVQANTGTNLNARVLRSDLTTISNSINTLRTADANATQQLQTLAAQTLDRANAQALLAIVQDPTNSAQNRDLAANLLQGKLMQLTPANREAVLKSGTSPDPAMIDALFTMRLSNGGRVFSVADLTTITNDQFAREMPNQTAQSFFRGNSVASALLGKGLTTLDNGRMTTLANNMLGAMRTEVQNAQQNGVALQTTAPNGATVPNPAIVNPALTAMDQLLSQQAATPELQTFLGGISNTINANNPPGNWTGPNFIKNAAVLRGLAPAFLTQTQADTPERSVATSVSAALQQTINATHAFAQHSPHVGLNPSVNAMHQPGSGFNVFLATVP
jgi:hypothetical protein